MARLGDFNAPGTDIGEYPLERILASRTVGGATKYLAKWEGYPDEDCTWEPGENFSEDTLAEWESQWANGEHLNEAEVAEVEAKMNAFKKQKTRGTSSKDNSSTKDNNLKHTVKSTRRRVPVPQNTATKRRMPSTRSDEPPAKRPKLQTTTQATARQTSGKLGTEASLSRIPTFGTKKGIASRIPKQGSSRARLNNTKRDNFEIGNRFQSLKHMNNYQKLSRREATPDISKLDLRAPDEFEPQKKVNDVQHQDEGLDTCDESPLFVPETHSDQTGDASAENEPLHVPSAGLAEVAHPQETSTLSILTTADTQKIPPEHRTSRPECPSATLNTERQSPPRDFVEDRADESARAHPSSSIDSPTAGRDEFAPPHKSAPQQVTEKSSVATDVALISAESHSHSAATEKTKQRPTLSRAVSQPSIFTSNIASMARRETATPSRWYYDVTESDAPPLSVPARISSVPVPAAATLTGPNGKVNTARNGRSWLRGELVVVLRYGSHSIGHIKTLHLPGWLITKLVNIKQGHDLVIHFQEQYVMNKAKFVSFALNLSNEIGLGAIQPYEDTASSIANLAEHLERHDICAVWEFPAPTTPGFVMVLYSYKAPSWASLGVRPVPGSEPRLHLLVRNKNHELDLATWVSSHNNHVNPDPVASISTSSRRLPPQEAVAATRRDPTDSVNSPVENPGTVGRSRSPYFGARSPRSPRTPRSPSRPRQDSHNGLLSKPDTTAAAATALLFSANFKDLGRIGDRDPRKRHIFYIAFAKSHPAEARAVEGWLLAHEVRKRAIFLDEEKEAWSDFRMELSSKQGTVLFRRGSRVYYTMKNLTIHLYEGLTCFNVSFPGDEEGSPGGNEALCRIFPRGTVLFITERSMLDSPGEVLAAMKWFEKKWSGKGQTHKMGLVPNAREWLLRRLAESARETRDKERGKEEDEKALHVQEQYLGILEVLYRLDTQAHTDFDAAFKDDPDWWLMDDGPGEEHTFMISVPSDLPGYETHDDDDDHEARPDDAQSQQMAASRVQARDEILVQYFVGWAALHVEHYKLFFLVDEEQTNDTVKNSCHVYFRKPAKLVEMIERVEKKMSKKG